MASWHCLSGQGMASSTPALCSSQLSCASSRRPSALSRSPLSSQWRQISLKSESSGVGGSPFLSGVRHSASPLSCQPGAPAASRQQMVCRAREQDYSQETKMREEVISPFRTLRMFFYIGFIGSAGLGAFVTLIRVIGQLAGGRGDGTGPLEENLIDLGIDVAALALFGFLYWTDNRAKDVQLTKLAREEALAQLRLELSSGRMVRVSQLRGACRLVVVAGPLSHVRRALALAAPLKAQLLERGVTIVPFVTEEDAAYSVPPAVSKDGTLGSDYKAFAAVVEGEAAELGSNAAISPSTGGAEGGTEGGGAAASAAASGQGQGTTLSAEQLKELESRWLARPLYTNEWEGWLKEQMRIANVDPKCPVYLSLRLDGRVRGSGVGFPRWQVIAAQLPPMKGMWGGAFDGMDGRVL